MAYEERKALMQKIEEMRGRKIVSLCNFDRTTWPEVAELQLSTQFGSDLKESLFRVLKESDVHEKGIDLFLYTRGGDTNAVWPIVSLLREFDPEFQVLVPFRAHSAGTMLVLAAKKIIMGRLSELSPIDPTTGNQFNPINQQGQHLGISVEDVRAYKDFIREAFVIRDYEGEDGPEDTAVMDVQDRATLQPYIQMLANQVHPIALGNIHRIHKLVQRLAKKLLSCNLVHSDAEIKEIVGKLTVKSYSHLHMFSRYEAKDILGESKVEFTDQALDEALDNLLREYENDFDLRSPKFLPELMGSDQEKSVTFAGGAVESRDWGYLFKTRAKITQFSKLSPTVSVQLPPGGAMPLIPGLPREYGIEVFSQKWEHNIKREGITT